MAKNTVKSFFSLRRTKTRVMATIGPSNHSYDHLSDMLDAGATIFRFNAAHIIGGEFDFEKSLKVTGVLEDLIRLSEDRIQNRESIRAAEVVEVEEPFDNPDTTAS